MKKFMFSLLLAGVMLGCGDQDTKVKITYYEKGEEALEIGKVLLFWAEYKTEDGEYLLDTRPEEPLAILYDTSAVNQGGLLMKTIDRLKVGDSVLFEIPSKNLWEVTFQRDLPDSIGENSSISVIMRIIDQVTREEYQAYAMEMEQKRNARFNAEEEKQLEAYFSEKGLLPAKTESGLRYIITKEGQGPLAKNNDRVNVRYKGMLLDGTEFDAGDYAFVLGTGNVIRGWDEGIAYLKVGSKATLYIPSALGYGSRGSGRTIPPFSSLIFEVELLEIIK